RWLADAGTRVEGLYELGGGLAVQFRDPDGVILEIAAGESGPPQGWPDPVPDIDGAMALRQGMDHWAGESSDLGRSHAFYGDLLGMPRIEHEGGHDGLEGRGWAWRAGAGGHVSFVEADVRVRPRAKIGVGQTHHFALAVADARSQLAWRERLVEAGLSVTPVLDRIYFQSIYTRDPDGHIVELATLGPGFAVDERPEDLGSALCLPPWLEDGRAEIERRMRPLSAPKWRGSA
ncbi:MAG: VOC family protein, partial [Anaerolineales bacterium]